MDELRELEQIKPCPFCAGEAELDFAGKNFTYTDEEGNLMDIGFFFTVKCRDEGCGCRIGVYENPHMAVDAWNRRANEN